MNPMQMPQTSALLSRFQKTGNLGEGSVNHNWAELQADPQNQDTVAVAVGLALAQTAAKFDDAKGLDLDPRPGYVNMNSRALAQAYSAGHGGLTFEPAMIADGDVVGTVQKKGNAMPETHLALLTTSIDTAPSQSSAGGDILITDIDKEAKIGMAVALHVGDKNPNDTFESTLTWNLTP